MQVVRNSVKENVLSDPSLVTDQDYVDYLTGRGKGWVCEIDQQIVGFSIVDMKERNVWALFLQPAYEAQGIGKKLHGLMLDWYFAQSQLPIWLGTAFNSRAQTFYRLQGWTEAGTHGSNEIKFEMTFNQWKAIKTK
jgi:GNAT superfamily N-acetyltransferase